ncbi:MAG: glycoside hydrolase family 27 protein [Bacteroidales bacterium]|nr:glycoside hydrolase family 27 protein [Bacteroidales bacterium]
MRLTHIALVAALTVSASVNAQKFEGLALTPTMGWNSWNTFACDIDENLVRETADLFVKLGLKDAGYEYVVIDDCWMEMERDPQTMKLVADHKKFPSGIKALADYIHKKGLKFGIYNCAGTKTCAGYPGTRGYEFLDARQYAEWGVDFLKYDWCDHSTQDARASYSIMRDAIYAAGRPMVFNICEWGDAQSWEWGGNVGHSWRVSGDIARCWDCQENYGGWAKLGLWPIIRLRGDIRKYHGPDHWNDFDMLEVGNGMSPAEDRTHFVMWSMLASPLILGNDIRKMSKETLELITNKEVIAVDQDKLGVMGFCFLNDKGFEVWVKPLDNNEWAVAFVNMTEQKRTLNYDWNRYVKDSLTNRELKCGETTYKLRDLLAKKDAGDTSKALVREVESHDVVVFRLSPVKK